MNRDSDQKRWSANTKLLVSGLLIALFIFLISRFSVALAFGVIGSAAWGIFIFVIDFYLIKDGARLWIWLDGMVMPALVRLDDTFMPSYLILNHFQKMNQN